MHTNEDLRSKRTEKALFDALFSLLKTSSFAKITVRGICEEAWISRAAFYSHFVDKYDLLKQWIEKTFTKYFHMGVPFEQLEEVINTAVQENMAILKNLLTDTDQETYNILFDFILSTIDMTLDKSANGEMYPRNAVFSNFYAGGILSYCFWQVSNRFPSEVPPMNQHFHEIIRLFHDWQSK